MKLAVLMPKRLTDLLHLLENTFDRKRISANQLQS